jgi:hypothetical protein
VKQEHPNKTIDWDGLLSVQRSGPWSRKLAFVVDGG